MSTISPRRVFLDPIPVQVDFRFVAFPSFALLVEVAVVVGTFAIYVSTFALRSYNHWCLFGIFLVHFVEIFSLHFGPYSRPLLPSWGRRLLSDSFRRRRPPHSPTRSQDSPVVTWGPSLCLCIMIFVGESLQKSRWSKAINAIKVVAANSSW